MTYLVSHQHNGHPVTTAHDTEERAEVEALVQCKTCLELRPSDNFYVQVRNGKTYFGKTCKRCIRSHERSYRKTAVARRGIVGVMTGQRTAGRMSGKERHAYWATYKMQAGCTDCGTHDWRILEFDHLPLHEKSFAIGAAVRATGFYSDEEIKAEVSKCEVVCRGCHLKRTANRARFPRARDAFQWSGDEESVPADRRTER